MKEKWSPCRELMVLGEDEVQDDISWDGMEHQWADFHDSGRYVARANNHGEVELWDLEKFEMLWAKGRRMKGDTANVRASFVGFRGDKLHIYQSGKLTTYGLDGDLKSELALGASKDVFQLRNKLYLAVGRKGQTIIVNLATTGFKKYDFSMMLADGQPAVDISDDGCRLLLGNDGKCVVLDTENGNVVYECEGAAMEEMMHAVSEDSHDKNVSLLEHEIAINTLKRNGMPTGAVLLPSGKRVVLLFGDYMQGLNDTEYASRVECLEVQKNGGRLVWESLCKGKGRNLELCKDPELIRLCESTENGQKIVSMDVSSGLIMKQEEYSIVRRRPYFSAAERELTQEVCVLAPDELHVVFTLKEPWIAAVGAGMMPLDGHRESVPLARFSKAGSLVLTYSTLGVVRIYELLPETGRGFMQKPLGWMIFFCWVLWGCVGCCLVWWYSQRKERVKYGMPAWYGALVLLATLRLAFMLTDNMADWAQFSLERSWGWSDVLYLMLLCSQTILPIFCLYALARGMIFGRWITIFIGALGMVYYMWLAVVSLGFFQHLTKGIERTWWGSPLNMDSDAFLAHILLSWLGYTLVIIIMMLRECRAWVNKRSEAKEAAELSPVTQGWGQYRT